MSQPAIRVEGLWKEYIIGGAGPTGQTFREQIVGAVRAPLDRLRRRGTQSAPEESFWALKDVSFDIQPGEVVGIIGRNGAGKSTLLKILSRITAPTKGRIEIRGRVASLLEVGTGFHQELTGRENIRLNGAILGMSRAEIARKFDEIVAFSGVEKFLDTPVKRYSSGMQVRLAFAVAAHLDPEILIVDEVLAVGDAEFQKKCLGKMGEIAGKGGRTVIFVSHNMAAVSALCSRGILLDKGESILIGDVKSVLTKYVQSSRPLSSFERSLPPISDVTLMCAAVKQEFNQDDLTPEIRLTMEILSKREMGIGMGIRVRDALGTPVGYIPVGAFDRSKMIQLGEGTNNVELIVSAENWATGSYVLSVDLGIPDVVDLDRVEDCLIADFDGVGGQGQIKSLAQAWGWGSLTLPPRQITVTIGANCGRTKLPIYEVSLPLQSVK